MVEDSRIPRRYVLRGFIASTLGAIAGCGGGDTQEAGESENTDTVVFTDSSTEEGPTKSTSDQSGEGDGTASSSPTENTQPSTAEDQSMVFDGGGTQAFVDALGVLQDRDGGTLIVEEGTYRFESIAQDVGPMGRHAFVREIEDVTIEGNDSTFVLTDPLRGGLLFQFGANLTIRNLNFDYDPLPFTQGAITSFSESERNLTLQIDDGYPPLDHRMFEGARRVWASIHEPNGNFVGGYYEDEPLFFENISKNTERTYDIGLAEGEPTTALQTGRKLTIVARGIHSVLDIHGIEQATIENVTIQATSGAAFSVGSCTDPVIQNCSIKPPNDSDRHIAADADGIRIIDCVSSVTVEGCEIDSIEDDGIVVQRNRTPVVELIDGRTVDVSEWHVHAKPGDVFDIISQTGVWKGHLPPVADMTDLFATPVERAKATRLVFEDQVDDKLDEGDLIGNRATASQQFVVRNNEIQNLRGVGLRVAAGRGLVEDNLIKGTSWNTIELECDTSSHFIPKGPVEDVTVRNNNLSRSGLNWFAEGHPAAIRLHHRPRHELSTEGRPNRNVTIVDNEIDTTGSIGIRLEDAESLSVAGNVMEGLNRLNFPDRGYGFWLSNIDGIELTGNSVAGERDVIQGFGLRQESSPVTLRDNKLIIDGESKNAEMHRWVPVTFQFDRTVSPDGTERSLAIRIFKAKLLNDNGSGVVIVDVGGREEGFDPGVGVHGKEQHKSSSWRWLGSGDGKATVYFKSNHIDQATAIEIQAKPIESGIRAAVSVDGANVTELSFGSKEIQTYRFPVPG